MLTLFEELLSLSIHEAKGTFIKSSTDRLKPGLVGAILAELALMGKIQASNSHQLQLSDDSQTTDDILNETLCALKESEKERKFNYWINTLSQRIAKLQKHIVKSLVQKGVITQDDDRLSWVIPSPLQSETKASTKCLLITRLSGIVLAQENTQLRDIALLSLARACGLLDLLFLRDELKLADRQINELVYSQVLNNPALQTMQEIERAIADLVEED